MINLNYTKEQIEQTPIKDKLAQDWLTLYDENARLNKALQGAMGEIENYDENKDYQTGGASDSVRQVRLVRGHWEDVLADVLTILRHHFGKE